MVRALAGRMVSSKFGRVFKTTVAPAISLPTSTGRTSGCCSAHMKPGGSLSWAVLQANIIVGYDFGSRPSTSCALGKSLL